jgi:acyl carrier protein
MADREQVERLLGALPDEHPLCAVVYAAGVLDDGVIGSLTAGQLERVLAPKVSGAWNLHELTAHLGLSSFVLFSSAAGVLGGMGQANYAAANAFLDSLAAHRRARGLAAVSIAWGLWGEVGGMTGNLGQTDLERISRSGIVPLSGSEGLELFDLAQAQQEALVLPMRLDRQMLRPGVGNGASPSMFRDLVRVSPRHVRDVDRGSLSRRLAAASARERGRIALGAVRAQTASVLGYASAGAIESQRTFKELGFDSLAAVELRNRMSAAVGITLPATLVFDYPTPAALAEHLAGESAEAVAEAGPAPGDRQFDSLQRLLASLSSDEASRSRLERSLRAALSELGEHEELGEHDRQRNGVAVAQHVQTASVEEVFDFIDRELGSSEADDAS